MDKHLSLMTRMESMYFKAKSSGTIRRISNTVNITCAAAMASLVAVPAFAANDTATAQGAVFSLINIMLSIFRYVGIALFVWGVIQFILATKRSDADSKADAIQTALCGIALMFIGLIVGGLGIGGFTKDQVNTDMLNGGDGS